MSVDTKGFQQMIKDLAFIQGKDLADVVKDEATAVLNKATRMTKAAKVAKIKSDELSLAKYFQAQASAGKPVRPSIQKRMVAAMRRKMGKKLLMRGMSKGTWYIIGRQLGLKVNAPKYAVQAAEKARAKLGKAVSGKEAGRKKYEITIKNFAIVPMTYEAGGFRAFTRAMRGRVSYFEKRLKVGFRERAKKAVKGKAKVT